MPCRTERVLFALEEEEEAQQEAGIVALNVAVSLHILPPALLFFSSMAVSDRIPCVSFLIPMCAAVHAPRYLAYYLFPFLVISRVFMLHSADSRRVRRMYVERMYLYLTLHSLRLLHIVLD